MKNQYSILWFQERPQKTWQWASWWHPVLGRGLGSVVQYSLKRPGLAGHPCNFCFMATLFSSQVFAKMDPKWCMEHTGCQRQPHKFKRVWFGTNQGGSGKGLGLRSIRGVFRWFINFSCMVWFTRYSWIATSSSRVLGMCLNSEEWKCTEVYGGVQRFAEVLEEVWGRNVAGELRRLNRGYRWTWRNRETRLLSTPLLVQL